VGSSVGKKKKREWEKGKIASEGKKKGAEEGEIEIRSVRGQGREGGEGRTRVRKKVTREREGKKREKF